VRQIQAVDLHVDDGGVAAADVRTESLSQIGARLVQIAAAKNWPPFPRSAIARVQVLTPPVALTGLHYSRVATRNRRPRAFVQFLDSAGARGLIPLHHGNLSPHPHGPAAAGVTPAGHDLRGPCRPYPLQNGRQSKTAPIRDARISAYVRSRREGST